MSRRTFVRMNGLIAIVVSVSIALSSPVDAHTGGANRTRTSQTASGPAQGSNPDPTRDVISEAFQTRTACDAGTSAAPDISKDVGDLSGARGSQLDHRSS
jgi:hypothetical protein